MPEISVAAIGECMIELSSLGEHTWKTSFAGDAFNTLWAMRALLPHQGTFDFVTAFGDDPFSEQQIEFLARNSIGKAASVTVPNACPGLYAITLTGHERSFTYWRNSSAARQLADDAAALSHSLRHRNVIYFSGITLAILPEEGRRNLFKALSSARRAGSNVIFDPNYRPRLWKTIEEARAAIAKAAEISNVLLPTFTDENELFGDRSPNATIERLRSYGVSEIVVKCGSEPAHFFDSQSSGTIKAEHVAAPIDTTGAGDAFNGGYIAGRVVGQDINGRIALGHRTAAVAVQLKGALVSPERVSTLIVGNLSTQWQNDRKLIC